MAFRKKKSNFEKANAEVEEEPMKEEEKKIESSEEKASETSKLTLVTENQLISAKLDEVLNGLKTIYSELKSFKEEALED